MRDDTQARASPVSKILLLPKGVDGKCFGKVRTAFGMSGDGNIRDAEPVEDSGIEKIHRARIRPHGRNDASSNNKHVGHAGMLGKLPEACLQRFPACDPSSRKVRHWYAARVPNIPRRNQHFTFRPRRADIGQIHPRSRRQQSCELITCWTLSRQDFNRGGELAADDRFRGKHRKTLEV